jgi:hypothetical protein
MRHVWGMFLIEGDDFASIVLYPRIEQQTAFVKSTSQSRPLADGARLQAFPHQFIWVEIR